MKHSASAPAGLSAETRKQILAVELLDNAYVDPRQEEMDLRNAEFIHVQGKKSKNRRLSQVANLSEAFKQFDLNGDDHIGVREQVTMYHQLKAGMQTSLSELARKGFYDQAAELRDRMKSIKREFEGRQVHTEESRQEKERRNFQTASKKIHTTKISQWGESGRRLHQECCATDDAMTHSHNIQTRQLEEEMAHLPDKMIKFSRTLLEMKDSETHLAGLGKFEEAKSLKRRVDKLEAAERDQHERNIEAGKNRRRALLQKNQADDRKKREQMDKKFEWAHTRAMEHDMKITNWRMSNNMHDMKHAHKVDSNKPPTFTTNQLLTKQRTQFLATGSTLRGSQLLASVATGRQAVAGLCGMHAIDDDDNSRLSGTMTLTK